jgi:predicted aconitase with swiveling domain
MNTRDTVSVQDLTGSHEAVSTRAPLAQPRADTHEVIVLRGRKVVGGVAEGEALVTRDTISGWGGVNPMLGTIIETRHELRGVSFKDKILVCPGAKGSSGWSAMFHTCRLAGTAPKAVIFNEMTTKIALGCVVMRVPSITELDRDPLEIIETGDWVKVDGDRGIVEIRKAGGRQAS